jgi:hypothetical protein
MIRVRAALALTVAALAFATGAAPVPALGTIPALAAECEGDECQPPAPAPDDPTPGTAVAEGPSNPPVHYPKVRKPHHHKKHHRGPHRRNHHRRVTG